METPIIDKKQARSSLSAKKKRKTEVIKNVLTKPYQNYWPSLSTEDNKQLKEVLDKFLPKLIPNKINIPYNQIKNIPKEERKNYREALQKKQNSEAITPEKNLIFGVNDVSKSIETQEAASVLIDSSVQPRHFVQHIIDQAVLYSLPVLVVTDLKQICREKCGLSGVTISIKKSVRPDSPLGMIHQTIRTLYENYPVPKNHINYNRRLDMDMSVVEIPDTEDEPSVCVVNDNELKVDYHLKRQKGAKRAFIPEKTQSKLNIFINLDSSTEIETEDNKSKDHHYQSLVVKKVKGNASRNKRKMEKFKRKKK